MHTDRLAKGPQLFEGDLGQQGMPQGSWVADTGPPQSDPGSILPGSTGISGCFCVGTEERRGKKDHCVTRAMRGKWLCGSCCWSIEPGWKEAQGCSASSGGLHEAVPPPPAAPRPLDI